MQTEAPSVPAAERAARGDFAMYSPRAWAVLLVALIAGLTLDLASKAWAFANVGPYPIDISRERVIDDPNYDPIPPHRGIQILPWDLLDFRLVKNRGAVFGIGENRRFLFIVFTLGALAGGLYLFARRTRASHTLAHLSLALILAGGLGNLYDRIMYAVVRDFLHMLPGWKLPFGLRYPGFLGGGNEIFPWVFNVADVMLLTGMGLLLIHIHRLERSRKVGQESAVKSQQSA